MYMCVCVCVCVCQITVYFYTIFIRPQQVASHYYKNQSILTTIFKTFNIKRT